MFREMRRNKQSMSRGAIKEVLEKATSGVLALDGDDDYPYAVPISYVYDQENAVFYFHGAKTGHKMDAIAHSSKASFCVIDQDQVVQEKYTSYYRSVIAFGRIRVLETEEEKRSAIHKLAVKYFPTDTLDHRQEAIDKDYDPMAMMALTVEHMTGKEALGLMRQREKEQGNI